MRLLNLADRMRDAGLQVTEVNGWRTRGVPFTERPRVVVGHHTASAPGRDMPSLHILTAGRPDLPGPLCQIGLSRSGVVHVIASGKANHAGPGQWRDVTSSSLTVGIEAENSGVGEPWPDKQLAAYDLCAAVLLDILEQPASMYAGHREWAVPAGRKIDPHGIDLDQMRGRIRRLLEEGFDMALSDDDVNRIAKAVWALKVGDPEVATRTALLRVEKRTEQLVEMVEKAAAGDAVGAKAIATQVRKELARSLQE
jgi:hypothetical protein